MKLVKLIFVTCFAFCSCHKIHSGIIIDKQYKASSESVGTAVTGSGQVASVVTGDPESWILIVKGADKNGVQLIESFDVKNTLYYSKQIGDSIYFK